MKYTINVTEEHIRNGKPKDSSCCPIALALKEIVPGADVDVDIEIVVGGERAETPPVACKFIDDFDAGIEVSPFSFEIELERNCDYCDGCPLCADNADYY